MVLSHSTLLISFQAPRNITRSTQISIVQWWALVEKALDLFTILMWDLV